MEDYAIDDELKGLRHMVVPGSPLAYPFANASLGLMKLLSPDNLNDTHVHVMRLSIAGADGAKVPLLIFEPQDARDTILPGFVYLHGGAFAMKTAAHHYSLARRFALETPCKVVLPDYRLAPCHRFPIPVEDCLATYLSVLQNAELFGIDTGAVAIGGDSAGGCLAAAVTLMVRDRIRKRVLSDATSSSTEAGTADDIASSSTEAGTTGDAASSSIEAGFANFATDDAHDDGALFMPRFQMLLYPVLDRRMQTDSMARFDDTPVWNSRLNRKMWENYLPKGLLGDKIAFASPAEAREDELVGLPPTYIETAEFDCLHDEDVAFAQRLRDAGVKVELNQTKGTVHGFDCMQKSKIAQRCVEHRIAVLRAALS